MMSSISPVLASHVPAFESGFNPWDISDMFSIFDSPLCPMGLNPGLEKINYGQTQNINQSYANPGLQVQTENRTGLKAVLPNKDDRRKSRKKSNRESAQRSRMRKQKHLEDVRSQLNQLKTENRELENRFRYIMHHFQRTKMENDHLRLEHHILQGKLLNLRQALVLRQIQQNSTCATWSSVNSTVVTVQQNPSMLRDHVI